MPYSSQIFFQICINDLGQSGISAGTDRERQSIAIGIKASKYVGPAEPFEDIAGDTDDKDKEAGTYRIRLTPGHPIKGPIIRYRDRWMLKRNCAPSDTHRPSAHIEDEQCL